MNKKILITACLVAFQVANYAQATCRGCAAGPENPMYSTSKSTAQIANIIRQIKTTNNDWDALLPNPNMSRPVVVLGGSVALNKRATSVLNATNLADVIGMDAATLIDTGAVILTKLQPGSYTGFTTAYAPAGVNTFYITAAFTAGGALLPPKSAAIPNGIVISLAPINTPNAVSYSQTPLFPLGATESKVPTYLLTATYTIDSDGVATPIPADITGWAVAVT